MWGKNFFIYTIACFIGLYLSVLLIANVAIDKQGLDFWKTLIFASIVLALLHLLVKPFINIIVLPLKLLTLGIIGIFVNVCLIELVDILFVSVHIKGFWALLLTSLIVQASQTTLLFLLRNKK